MYLHIDQIKQRAYWNANSYGSAIRIKRVHLISIAVIACICTPGTNWLIPMLGRFIKTGLTVRW